MVRVVHQDEPFVLIKVCRFYMRSKRKVLQGLKGKWVARMMTEAAKWKILPESSMSGGWEKSLEVVMLKLN